MINNQYWTLFGRSHLCAHQISVVIMTMKSKSTQVKFHFFFFLISIFCFFFLNLILKSKRKLVPRVYRTILKNEIRSLEIYLTPCNKNNKQPPQYSMRKNIFSVWEGLYERQVFQHQVIKDHLEISESKCKIRSITCFILFDGTIRYINLI